VEENGQQQELRQQQMRRFFAALRMTIVFDVARISLRSE
jgi:hypothetical protein